MTPFNNQLDRGSISPRFQAFEKFVSRMYPGEITRSILIVLVGPASRPLLFNGRVGPGILIKHYGLDSRGRHVRR
jgi:hexokinase